MVNWKKKLKQIPSRIQLTRKTYYEICWVDSFPDESVLGETRFNPNQIVIKKGMSPKETVHTYFHELLHAYSNEYKSDLTENQVKSLEKGLYFLLKSDNIFKKGKK